MPMEPLVDVNSLVQPRCNDEDGKESSQGSARFRSTYFRGTGDEELFRGGNADFVGELLRCIHCTNGGLVKGTMRLTMNSDEGDS